jgi:2-polyprenyl-3-methyl-5-hydroxy-6-metoxy-1,4-benzoquinol methylase
MTDLVFTGERYLPECPREMLYEHYARYAMALNFVAGKRVLDCACGEGYGSAILASRAAQVVGVDLADQAIAHAQAQYKIPNLSFQTGNAAALTLEQSSFDVIVSFETLEHLLEQEQMLVGFKRLLKPGGVLLISSPDKANYSDATGYRNEFHLKELYRDEFVALLNRHFAHHRLFAQALNFQSMVWDLHPKKTAQTDLKFLAEDQSIRSGMMQVPMYYLAVASDVSDELIGADLYCFTDQAQSIYTHYNDEIRKGIRCAEIIRAQQEEMTALKALLAAVQGSAR